MPGRKRAPKNTQQQARAHERMMRAVELRKHGATFDSIARTVGYASASGAYNAVMRVLRNAKREAGEELIQLEVERLDAMLLAIAPAVQNGNLHAIDRALKIAARRAALLGLDAPKEVDVTSGGKVIEFACDPGFGEWVPPDRTPEEQAALDNLEAELEEELKGE
jgi:hypothetical protein